MAMLVGVLFSPTAIARASTCTSPFGFTTIAATDLSVTNGVRTSLAGRYPAGTVAICLPPHAGTVVVIAIDDGLHSTASEPNRET